MRAPHSTDETTGGAVDAVDDSVVGGLDAELRRISVLLRSVQNDVGVESPVARRVGFAVERIEIMRRMFETLEDFREASLSEPTMVELDEVVERVLARRSAEFVSEGGMVVVDRSTPVWGDADEYELLFDQLLDNAVRFRGDEPPVVRISARVDRETPTFAIVEITDQGRGFQPEHAEVIFEPFVALVDDDHRAGAGMGLAVCRRIVERYGGSITAESELGQGATFRLHLPTRPPATRGW